MTKLYLYLLLLLVCAGAQAQSSDFARGADVSWCTEMEADGRKFYRTDGTETELFALMKEIGMTAIRLRVWVNPKKYGYGAWCDKTDVVAKAKRAHAQGLDLMIDFHYSDIFADPGTQNTPVEWAGYSLAQLKTAVATHTKDVLGALKQEGIEPKWVQVGNETNNGLLMPTGKIDWNKSGTARYTDYVALSNAGYDAVKEVLPNAFVIVHLGGTDSAGWFFKEFKSSGGKFDMIGLSHYPTEAEWNSTATTAKYSNVSAANSVKSAAGQFGVPVMICETGFDVSKPTLASQVMTDLFTRMKAIPQCAGIFYWEPEVDGLWKPNYYNTIGWRAYSLGAFTTNGRPTAALNAFSGKTGDQTHTFPSQLAVYDKNGTKVLTTLNPTAEGIYAGQLNVTEPWLNFHVVDEEHNIWYGTDPSDKTAVSAADGHWNFWIDSETTGIYDIEIDLGTMKWRHTISTAIHTVSSSNRATASYYDLQGRRLTTPSKGLLLIRTGKKVHKALLSR